MSPDDVVPPSFTLIHSEPIDATDDGSDLQEPHGFGLDDSYHDFLDFEPDDSWAAWGLEDGDINQLLDFELVDDRASSPRLAEDELGEQVDRLGRAVTNEVRARQLAAKFLIERGDWSQQRKDWLAEIIMARGWGAPQAQVESLLQRGSSYEEVYLAFSISDAWESAGYFDTCCEASAQHVKTYPARDRISWANAINIVEFLGADASLESAIDFIEFERSHWCDRSDLRRSYPRFSDYLFKYRISKIDRRPKTIDQINLPPEDERTFDGGRNPAFSPGWWGDELDYPCTEDLVRAHIVRGGLMANLLGDL
ncbi:hypothetical protein DVT68_10630 [Dyella solisilvae]|uniref:Uncharacterized protein n=2 Tax=Dyella solisilvae TaxID=1920168 RepID=A0A370K8G3_9GAMM|nr:hypothetical protein DVT68_10630 [Dyella solisilvae]